MALTERTRVREILFVQDDNSLAWHCHQVPITEILNGGVVISAQYGAAQALTVEAAGELVGDVAIGLAAHRDALLTRVSELEARIAELEAE